MDSEDALKAEAEKAKTRLTEELQQKLVRAVEEAKRL